MTLPLLLLAVLAAPPPRASALDPRRALTQYQSRSWGPENGLPCHNVLAIVQTTDGYLWLGTEEGLVRFDGMRTRVSDRQTDPVLGGNNVSSVVEDARHPGQLLLGSAGGVTRLANGKIEAFSSGALAGQPGRILTQDPADGALWVKTLPGLFRVSSNGEVTGPFEAASGWPVETIRTLCRDGAGRLWVGTARGLYRQHDGAAAEGPRFDLLPAWAGKAIDQLTPGRTGGLWVGSRDAGTGRLDEDGAFHPRAALAGCVVTSLLEDRDGMLWVGTQGSGLFRFPARENTSTGSEGEALTAGKGLISNEVRGLCEDREGNLWVVTQKGLQMLRDARFVNLGRPEGLAGDDVRTILEDGRGRLWVGHENGLSMLDPAAGDREVVNYPAPPSPRRPGDGLVLCVGPGEDDDTLLAGTHAGLLRWRAGKLEPLPVREDLDNSAVRALCLDAAGNHWVGADSGLYQVRGNQVLAHVATAGGLAADVVHALHADRRGNLWIGTSGGLSRRGPDGQIENFLTPGAGSEAAGGVLAFFEDPNDAGDLFVGTEFGLHRLRVTADGAVRITGYTVREGLFDDVVWSVLGDGRGNLWMSSNKGVSRVARADLDRFDRREITAVPHVAYGVADGMRSREGDGGHQPLAWRDHTGRLWFATVRGAACVDPARLAPNVLPPPVQIEELLADGRVVPAEGMAPGAGGPPAELAPGTQKLGFRYTALSLVVPEANRFRYRLEGFDAGWTDAGTERTAHYTNLPPGHYRFCVQAANADGVWNTVGAALAFRLRPFFYQTGWFRALVVGAAVTLLWTGQQRLRRRWQARLARAEAELRERERTQETLRAAKEEAEAARREAERANHAKSEFLSRMSHELRTPLNAILGFGQLLELEQLSSAQSQGVEHILGGGRHLLSLVDDILDLARIENGAALLRPEDLALAPLLAEVAGLIEPLARERDVCLRVEDPGDAYVRTDRQRLKQVLFNLLANAVKYNRPVGGEVVVGVEEGLVPSPGLPRGHRIYVRDTGVGIDPAGLAKLFTPFERLGAAYGPVEGTGLGLAVSKQLVQAIGGTIGVESTPGVGSTFWVELPALAVPAALLSGLLPSPTPGTAARRHPPLIPPAEAGGPSLLYIEDNASNRQFVESVVAQHRPDLVLRCAANGRAGLAAARARPRPGLILLDLQLPDLPGAEVLSGLRAEATTREIPVVVLSADATARSRARLLGLGADDYLTKPLELPRLLELLAARLPILGQLETARHNGRRNPAPL